VRHPWWVKTRPEPKYEIRAEDYERFDARKTVFGSFEEYVGEVRARQLFEQSRSRRVAALAADEPGLSLADRALAFGAQTVWQSEAQQTLYSWTSPRSPALEALNPERRRLDVSPEQAARIVKRAARFYGALMVGIAELNRSHVYSHDHRGRPIVFRDTPEPVVTDEELVIPESCRWVVALAVRQDWTAVMGAPNALSSAAVALGYSTMPVVAGSLAEFIRALGYNAIPCGNDTALSVPIAIDAGLGEFGRHARLITPRYGSNVRLAKVICDLPMSVDRPIDFGVVEFCMVCKKCALHCPSGAISLEREPSFETRGPWNRAGVKMWHEDAVKCFEQWHRETTGCSICVRVCPYNHADTVVHRAVMAAIATTTLFNRLFAAADDLFGYGRQAPPQAFWAS